MLQQAIMLMQSVTLEDFNQKLMPTIAQIGCFDHCPKFISKFVDFYSKAVNEVFVSVILTEKNRKAVDEILSSVENLKSQAENMKDYHESYLRLKNVVTQSVSEKVSKILVLGLARGTINQWVALIAHKIRNIHSDVNNILQKTKSPEFNKKSELIR